MQELLNKIGGVKNVLIGSGLVVIALLFLFVNAGYRYSPTGHMGVSGIAVAPQMGFVNSDMAMDVDGGARIVSEKSMAFSDQYSAPRIPSSLPIPTPNTPPMDGNTKIIKSADLSLYVKNVDETAGKVDALRTQLRGHTGGSYFTEYTPGVRSGDMTIWVPSASFDSALTALKQMAIQVRQERITATDVSAQFVDLSARLKNLHATETQLMEIMKRSGTVADILSVSRELSNTRAQIEQLQGTLDSLSAQVDYSSIHLSLTQEPVPSSVGNSWSPVAVFKTALKGVLIDLTSIADMGIVFLVRLPILLINLGFWVLICLGLWKLAKFAYRKIRTGSI